ncbi:hypothetical protein C8R43DRAFT_966142 [Mycena crocata]|nr:hypothetical protein C8R43DRAFT_966142 [Mycena crocata]
MFIQPNILQSYCRLFCTLPPVSQAVLIAEGGARVEQGNEAEAVDVETPETAAAKAVKKKKRKAARTSLADALEARFLSRFACTTECRRLLWDEYFGNAQKASLEFVLPEDARCCEVCEPAHFPVALVVVEKIPGLKGGKKRKFPPGLGDLIQTRLRSWSRAVLMPLLYPPEAGASITGSALLPDSTIEQIATCGECVDSLANLKCRARWLLMESHGDILFAEVQNIFQSYDSLHEDDPPAEPPANILDTILDGPRRGRHGRGTAPGRVVTRGHGRGATAANRGAEGTPKRARGRPRGSSKQK